MPSPIERLMSALRLATGFRREAAEDADMREEMAFHIEMQTAKNVASGMEPDAAGRAAVLAFGGATRWRESGRDEVRSAPLESLWRDVRGGARALRANPTFALSATATLGLAIAAAVTAFSFVNAIFLKPLPAPSADRLARVQFVVGEQREVPVGTSGVQLLRTHHDVFDKVAAEACCWLKFARERGALQARYTAFASADMFPMLGLSPRLGRFFTRDETDHFGREPVAVLSYALWRSAFGLDPKVIGEHIAIDGHTFTIVGVGPEGFDGIDVGGTPSQLWLPSSMMGTVGIGCDVPTPCHDAGALVRLAPGVSLAKAGAVTTTLASQLSRLAYGDDSVRRVTVDRAVGATAQDQRRFLPLARLLAAIAGALLLIACANLSGLLLVRGVSRQREIALRLSLGATRLRIVRQLLSESILLASLGAMLGVLLSTWTARALMGFFASDDEGFQHFLPIGLDARVLWFAVGIATVTTLLFALLPAIATARGDAAEVLKGSGGGSARGAAKLGLISAQVALSTALLCGAALLSRSFAHLVHAQRFDPTHVALFRVRPAAAAYDSTRAEQYVRAVAERVAALPGVESVGFARGVGLLWSGSPVNAAVGRFPGDSATQAQAHFVSPGFFANLRIPLLQGREFGTGDRVGAPLVAVVNEAFARRLWPKGDAVNRTVYANGKAFRVVGVVPDYLVRTADALTPDMFFAPFWQNALGPEKDARFAVRVRGDPVAALATIRDAVTAIDRNVPVMELLSMPAQVDATLPQIRLGQSVLLAAGGLALFLCAIGLYGTIAFLVARRTREIGIRVALGAAPTTVTLRFIGEGMRASLVGLVVGVVAAALGSRFLNSWLIGVPPHDAIAFGSAVAALLAVTFVASAIPARAAANVEPVLALRAP